MRLSQAFLYSPDVTIRGLSELLVKSEVLKVLELVRINFNGEAIAYLAEGLKANRSLNAIRFRSCAFGPEKGIFAAAHPHPKTSTCSRYLWGHKSRWKRWR